MMPLFDGDTKVVRVHYTSVTLASSVSCYESEAYNANTK